MNAKVAALLLSFSLGDPAIDSAMRSARTDWDYDQRQTFITESGHVRRATEGGEANANRQPPWNAPAGTAGVEGITSHKWRYIPRGGEVLVWMSEKPRKDGTTESAPVWAFPPGTIFGEILIHRDLGVFEVRTRIRTKDNWETAAFTPQRRGVRRFQADNVEPPTPPGYKRPADCVSCHQDAGTHASFHAKAGQPWTGWIRGNDGILSDQTVLEVPEAGFRMDPVLKARRGVRMRRDGEPFRNVVDWLAY